MKFWYPILGLISTIAIAEGAIAHGVVIQTDVQPTVEVVGLYDNGQPLKQAQVRVFSSEDIERPVFTGITDDKGRFEFQPTERGPWEIFIRQAGHGGKTVVVLDDTKENKLIIANASTAHSLPQRLMIIGAVTWGCVGTALYFKGRMS